MILDKLIAKFKPNPHLKDKIAEIGLTTRTYHCLRRSDVVTVGDLTKLTRKNISGFRGSNRGLCEEVEKVLSGLGLGLRKGDKRDD